MIALIIGSFLLLLGLPFLIRGWVFTLKPEHPATLKAKERNMRMGLETNMKIWGRKVRRVGFLLSASGGALAAWGGGLFG
jgi:hypothetical protein